MRISKLSLKNYRTFEDLEIEFPNFYTAICGQNDAGKSNVIRALQLLLGVQEPYFRRRSYTDLSLASDYPKWLPQESRFICVSVVLEVFREHDAGLYSFINEWLELKTSDDSILLTLKTTLKEGESSSEISVSVGENTTFTGLKAQEVNNRLRSTLLIHNSTEADYRFSFAGELDEFSDEYGTELENISKKASSSLKRVAKAHKEEITNLLGRLSRNYKVEISLPDISLNHLPYDLTLGDSKIDVALSEWGSGTKNRTMIFLALLKARQISQSITTSSKITPVLVIEEPESFLHPSAQAEFGRILQDLSGEFGVQVITTTHSPYMLSKEKPESNVLLERKVIRDQYRGSQLVSTSGDNWMEPFSLILGLASEEFRPWKELFFGNNESILLVEGITDKDYFEMLRSIEHGANQLLFEGTIFDYDGFGALKNPTMLKFIKNRSKTAFITYDLDVEDQVKPGLEKNGFTHKSDFIALGLNKAGMRNIEGLLPRQLVNDVNASNHEIVQSAISGTKDEQTSAKSKLKALYLQDFKTKSKPGEEWFGEFYKFVKIINKAFSTRK
jgi:putative ATP-dependent endonuclease of the OLD family